MADPTTVYARHMTSGSFHRREERSTLGIQTTATIDTTTSPIIPQALSVAISMIVSFSEANGTTGSGMCHGNHERTNLVR